MKVTIGILALATALAPLGAQATQAGQVAPPETPAGHALKAWLDAFNSGDSASLASYYRRYEPEMTTGAEAMLRRQTGGFELVSVEKSEPLHLEYIVKENEGHGFHNEENRFEFYEAMERFLEKHLK